jgi:hypothetical protein
MAVNSGDILRVAARLNGAAHGDITNVWHVRFNGPGPITDAVAVSACVNYMEDVYTPVKSNITDNYDFEDVNVFNVTQDKPAGVAAWSTLVKGGDTGGETMPPQVAAFVRGTTGYSRNWAKKFIGGLGEAVCNDAGFVSDTFLANLAALGVAWLTGYSFATDNTLTPVVYHLSGATWRDIVEVVVRNVWSTVRTRRTGRGS